MASLNFKTRTPQTPTILTAKNDIGVIELFTNTIPVETNEKIEIWGSNTNNRAASTFKGATNTGKLLDYLEPGTTQYYWCRGLLVDTSAVGSWYPAGVSAGVSAFSNYVETETIIENAINDVTITELTPTTWVSAFNVYGSASEYSYYQSQQILVSGRNDWVEVDTFMEINNLSMTVLLSATEFFHIGNQCRIIRTDISANISISTRDFIRINSYDNLSFDSHNKTIFFATSGKPYSITNFYYVYNTGRGGRTFNFNIDKDIMVVKEIKR